MQSRVSASSLFWPKLIKIFLTQNEPSAYYTDTFCWPPSWRMYNILYYQGRQSFPDSIQLASELPKCLCFKVLVAEFCQEWSKSRGGGFKARPGNLNLGTALLTEATALWDGRAWVLLSAHTEALRLKTKGETAFLNIRRKHTHKSQACSLTQWPCSEGGARPSTEMDTPSRRPSHSSAFHPPPITTFLTHKQNSMKLYAHGLCHSLSCLWLSLGYYAWHFYECSFFVSSEWIGYTGEDLLLPNKCTPNREASKTKYLVSGYLLE